MRHATVCLLACWALPVRAEAPLPDPDAVRAAMDQSLARQRESVQKQIRAAEETAPGWYTVPWTKANEGIAPVAPIAPAEPAATEQAANCLPLPPWTIESHLRSAAREGGLAPELLRAVVRKESGYRPCAVSAKGAMGLMQLMPLTAMDLGVANPFDPVENLYGGARLLGRLLGRYDGDLRLALGAYNAGPGAVDSHGGVPPYLETQDYVRSILGVLGQALGSTMWNIAP